MSQHDSDANDLESHSVHSSTETRSTDGDDDGADLKDFIVSEASDVEDEDAAPVAVAGDTAVVDAADAPGATPRAVDDDVLAVAESAKIISELACTVVNGRALRDRARVRKPTDIYVDNNAADIQRTLEEDARNDALHMIAALRKEVFLMTDADTGPRLVRAVRVEFKGKSDAEVQSEIAHLRALLGLTAADASADSELDQRSNDSDDDETYDGDDGAVSVVNLVSSSDSESDGSAHSASTSPIACARPLAKRVRVRVDGTA